MRKEACLACTKGGVRRCGLQGAYPGAAGVDGGAPVDDGVEPEHAPASPSRAQRPQLPSSLAATASSTP